MDTYQPIYDAVRSRIGGGNVGDAVERAVHNAFDISRVLQHVQQEIYAVSYEWRRPSVLFRPRLFIDGNMYCALYGEDLMNGCAGFGKTAADAMADFDKNWTSQQVAQPHKCPRCDEPNPDRVDQDGCRDPSCPERSFGIPSVTA